MSIRLYMDHHIPRSIAQGLKARGIDVLTAYEDGAHRTPDSELLDRANELERVLFTQDQDFLIEAVRRQQSGKFFRGVICNRHSQLNIGDCIRDLEIIAKVYDPEDLLNRVEYLPL